MCLMCMRVSVRKYELRLFIFTHAFRLTDSVFAEFKARQPTLITGICQFLLMMTNTQTIPITDYYVEAKVRGGIVLKY